MRNTKPKSKKKKIFFIILSIVVTLIIAGDWILTVMVYNENFNQRFESYEPLMLYVDDFDGLHRTKYEFSSNEGQKLAGNSQVCQSFYSGIAGAATVFAVCLHTTPK